MTDLEFYEQAKRFAIKYLRSQEFIEDFPSWAYVSWVERGRCTVLNYLYVDYLRFKFGRNPNGPKALAKRAGFYHELYEDQALSKVDFDFNILSGQLLELLDNDSDRTLFQYVYIEGLVQRDIATIYGVDESRICQRIGILIKLLKEQLQRKENHTLKCDRSKPVQIVRMGPKATPVVKKKKEPKWPKVVWTHEPRFTKIEVISPEITAFIGYFKELREAEAPTVKQFAKKSGLPANTISSIESGKTIPPIEDLPKYARALEIWEGGEVFKQLKYLWESALTLKKAS